MGFVQIISQKKFALVSIFFFLYVALNLFDGERGLISYYKNKEIKQQLINEKKLLQEELISVEKKNSLLTGIVDLDYLEILYREKFMLGKKNEKVFASH
tara:strand:+ start:152 stop:448 length:297 start_codon:yes stop_codon:yes gene_type:complete